MEEFTENHSNILISKEWLVKVDNANSIPYLFKFGFSEEKTECFVLITDTKAVWTEVLTRTQMFRRWRQCNSSLDLDNGDNSFSGLRSLVGDLHSPGAISDANFDIVESRDADLAFEIDCDEFKWRWDAYLLGPRTSADVISKHLILPLISLAHVSFYSADPVSELGEEDLEKTVDRIGRTARRSIDIHVKHTLARPKIATTLQRISSLLGLVHTLPSIRSEAEPPDLKGKLTSLRAFTDVGDDASHTPAATDRKFQHDVIQTTPPRSPDHPVPVVEAGAVQPAADADSATESDDDGDQELLPSKDSLARNLTSQDTIASDAKRGSEDPPPRPISRSQQPDSDSPPTKKFKTKPRHMSDSDSDSDSGTKSRSQGSQSASGGRVAGRGVRQPIKRGGRRF